MMLAWDLLVALVVGILLVGVFTAVFGRPRAWAVDDGPAWAGILAFFAIIFLTAWAGGRWVRPFGPPLFGVIWLPYLIMGLIALLLIAAAAPPPPRARGRSAAPPPLEADAATVGAGLSLFFWVILAVLLVVILAGYAV